MKKYACITLLFALTACVGKQEKLAQIGFHFPIITVPPYKDTVKTNEFHSMLDVGALIVGKFRFSTDSINFPYKADSSFRKDYLYDANWDEKENTADATGFEILPNYSYMVPYSLWGEPPTYFFPVYVLNETQSIKYFNGKGRGAYAIQEAQDSSHEWRPIDHRGWDFCGNGRFGVKVHPKEYIMCLFPRCKGNYKTLMRIRFNICGNIYVSLPFKGEINYDQFHFSKEGVDNWLANSPSPTTSYWYFWGAWPLDYDKVKD